MKRYTRVLKAMMVIGPVIALALPVGDAWGGSKIFTSSGVTSTIRGSVETNAFNNRDPFVAEVFSSGGECLLLAVTSQGADLEMTLVGPSGRVWQDDDSNGALRPRIRAITVTRGWHILILSSFSGASVNADFTMTMLRTTSTSALCNPPTGPSIFAPAPVKEGSLGAGPQGGAND